MNKPLLTRIDMEEYKEHKQALINAYEINKKKRSIFGMYTPKSKLLFVHMPDGRIVHNSNNVNITISNIQILKRLIYYMKIKNWNCNTTTVSTRYGTPRKFHKIFGYNYTTPATIHKTIINY